MQPSDSQQAEAGTRDYYKQHTEILAASEVQGPFLRLAVPHPP